VTVIDRGEQRSAARLAEPRARDADDTERGAGPDPDTAFEADLGEALEALPDPGPGSLRTATVRLGDLDPIALFAAARELDLEAALWLQPSEGMAIVGVGRAWATEPGGPTRFAEAGRSWRALIARSGERASAGGDGTGRPEPRPGTLPRGAGALLLGGLGFTGRTPAADDAWAPFGSASLVLPELTFARTADGSFATASVVEDDGPAPRVLARRWVALVERARELAPATGALVARPAAAPLVTTGERPDRATWDRLVGLFAGAVGRGRLDKVVLARRVALRSPLELDPVNALRRLAAAGPESTTFAFVRDGITFLGATPERLARTEGRVFQTAAVAGSAPRGSDAAEDARLAAALRASDKEREEHAVVVAMLRDALRPIVERLEVAPAPEVLALRHVQHLVTPMEGVLRDETGILALAELLHPTPAVGGEPRDAALTLIAEHEGFDRGWYAGPVGLLGADGDGELMVALRCGIVDGQGATLFAGCGIVADSDPAREWEESRIKLRPVASALGRLEEGMR
jgi:isochorismate synthase